MTAYKLDKILFPSTTTLAQISQQSIDSGIQYMIERPAGHPLPMFTAVQEQRPTITFTTSQLSTLLGVIGASGASLASTVAYLKKSAAAGGYVARATEEHITLTIASSVGYWSTITLPHNGRGEAQCTLQCVYDGSNEPIVPAGSAALNGTISATEYFGAGPVAINGTAISGVQEITIESGVQLIITGQSSEVWPRLVHLQQTEPTVTVRCNHEVNWTSLGLDGTALNGSAGITFYARKYAANGGRVADATTQHIKFVGALGIICPTNSSGQDTDLVSDTLRATLVASSDSAAALAITTGSAIT